MKPIARVLIANRGEIAIRVARAARDHGIVPVAIYSDGDRNAQHVLACDEAFALDGKSAAESYLNIEKIIAIAKKANIDAIHPGYGFLSENATFAAAAPAYVFMADESPLHRKLGVYEVRG